MNILFCPFFFDLLKKDLKWKLDSFDLLKFFCTRFFVFKAHEAAKKEEERLIQLRVEGERARNVLSQLGKERTDFALKMKNATEQLHVERSQFMEQIEVDREDLARDRQKFLDFQESERLRQINDISRKTLEAEQAIADKRNAFNLEVAFLNNLYLTKLDWL